MATNNATNTSNPITVAQGGTGLATLTAHAVQVGNGTSAITQLTVGTTGQLLAGATGADPAFSAAAGLGASLVLISSQTASNVASISWTGLSTYTNYLLIWRGVWPITSTATMQLLVSADSGSNYQTTGYLSGLNYSPYNLTTLTNLNSTAAYVLTGPLNSGVSTGGNVWIHSINTGDITMINGTCSWADTTLATRAFGTIGGSQGTTGVNAIKVQMSSGNINIGVFDLYGIRES